MREISIVPVDARPFKIMNSLGTALPSFTAKVSGMVEHMRSVTVVPAGHRSAEAALVVPRDGVSLVLASSAITNCPAY